MEFETAYKIIAEIEAYERTVNAMNKNESLPQEQKEEMLANQRLHLVLRIEQIAKIKPKG